MTSNFPTTSQSVFIQWHPTFQQLLSPTFSCLLIATKSIFFKWHPVVQQLDTSNFSVHLFLMTSIFPTVRLTLIQRWGTISIIKLQNCPIRTLYLLNMMFWMDYFAIKVQNSYLKVLWLGQSIFFSQTPIFPTAVQSIFILRCPLF